MHLPRIQLEASSVTHLRYTRHQLVTPNHKTSIIQTLSITTGFSPAMPANRHHTVSNPIGALSWDRRGHAVVI